MTKHLETFCLLVGLTALLTGLFVSFAMIAHAVIGL